MKEEKEQYEYVFYFGARHDDWDHGIYAVWTLEGKDDVDEAKARMNHEF